MKIVQILAVMLAVLMVGGRRGSAQEKLSKFIELWPNGAPGAAGNTDEDKPAILPFLPDAKDSTGAAILVCPGGGFTTRCVDFEGVEIGQWFQARGISAFVLRYRIRPMYGMQYSMADAQPRCNTCALMRTSFISISGALGSLDFPQALNWLPLRRSNLLKQRRMTQIH